MTRKKRKPTMREAFEDALATEPDDLGTHAAYADWLSEQDDPGDRARGEFIAVQMVRPSIPGAGPISGRSSGVKDSGPLTKRRIGAFSRIGKMAVAFSK